MKDDNSIQLIFTGDFAPINRAEALIAAEQCHKLFNGVEDIIDSVDIAITNLETPLLDNGIPIQKTGPNLKAKEKCVEALKYAGFDMACLGNNHIMDYGEEGLVRSLDICAKSGIITVGAGLCFDEASRYKTITVNDKAVSFINVCENEWSTTQGNGAGTNPLNEINIYHQIKTAKKESDYVILVIHGGHELYGLPSPKMKQLYRWFIEIGIDAVIGHHAHYFCGYEIYQNKPIVYGLGNFVFDNPQRRDDVEWTTGCLAKLSLQEDKVDLELIPYHQFDGKEGINLYNADEKKQFQIVCQEKMKVILDDHLLENSFDSFIKKNRQRYMSWLEPTTNKYVLWAIKRNLWPTRIKGRYKPLLLNLIRCESHREFIMKMLS